MPTRRSVRQRLLSETGMGFTGTATGGAALTLIDTAKLQRSGHDSRAFVGQWLLRPAAAAVDQERETSAYTPASGTLTQDGVAYSVVPASGDIYEVSAYFNLTELNNIIARALTRCGRVYWTPLSLITDFDMEAAGITDWTASNATLSKVTTSGFRGTQALRVANSLANGYAQSVTLNTPSPMSYYLEAMVRITSGTAILRAWDVTGSAAIYSVTNAEFGQQLIILQFTTPASSRQTAVRLIGSEATADATWDNVVCFRMGQTQFSLPSWLTESRQIISVHRQLRRGTSTTYAVVMEDAFEWPMVKYDLEEDILGTVPLRIHLWESPGSHPIWIRAHRPFAAPTSDTAELTIDEDWLVEEAKKEFYRELRGLRITLNEKDLLLEREAIMSARGLASYHDPVIARPIQGIW